jgi:Phytanoyl-CoA dioxygenase (PhyH)
MIRAPVQEFMEQGAATIDTPLAAAEVGAAVEALDRLLPFRPPAPGEKPRYRVSQTCSYHEPALLDVIQHPFFEEVAKHVLNADALRFFQTAIVTAYPEPDTPWRFEQHVDIQYRLSDFHAAPRRVICSYFLWLTDVNERRAPMMFRPGSHLLLAEENERRASPNDVGVVRPRRIEELPALDYAGPVPLLARAGQVSVLTTAAVHGASVNVDDQPRKGMVLTFVADGVEIGLPDDQRAQKRRYDAALRPLLRPERRHIVAA